MSRLIDADALQLAIVEEGQANKRKKYNIGDIWELTGAEIRDVINSQPTIQPEIVRCVRCEECLYRKICSWEKQGAKFCSFAERREVTT